MTRKDYNTIAHSISQARTESGGEAGELALDAAVERLAHAFASDNPNFQPNRFRKACQFQVRGDER